MTTNPTQNGMRFNVFDNAVQQALYHRKSSLEEVNKDIVAHSKDGSKVAAVYDTGGCGSTFYVICLTHEIIEGQEFWHVEKIITIDPSGDGIDAMNAADTWVNHP